MKHLVVEDVAYDVAGNAGTVELPIDDDLFQRGIEATELASPGASAPAEARFYERTAKILPIQSRKHGFEVVMRASRAMLAAAGAALA